ncbi:MAG: hypothetical protein EZS28_046477 [Streblomastix strix]|uniref:Uncharacterized protein n=2 Tax=Streblomastix strix TaxID=222440 RepID=A0A5J4THL5_9EUKA|nr:MAG: hypothetical protein EZS28_046477 [Streblomastix strix]
MNQPNFTFEDIKSKIGVPGFITIVAIAAFVVIIIITIFVCVCCYHYHVVRRRRDYEEGNSDDDSEASEFDRRTRSYRHQYDQYIRNPSEYDSFQDVQITICKYPYKLKNAQVDSDTLHAFTYDNHRGYRFQFSTVDSLQLVRCVAQTIADLGEVDQNGIMMLEKNHPIYLTLSPYLIYILLDKNKV